SLRQVAGSGFDIVEQAGGGFEIIGSSVRHVTLTGTTADTGSPITITALGSALMQVWIGDSLSGAFDASDCLLVHVWNGSGGVKANASACRFHGLVNVSTDGDCTPMGPDETSEFTQHVDPECIVQERARTTDYRRDPWVMDWERRAPVQ